MVDLTSNKNKISLRQINYSFGRCGERSKVPFRVKAHVLRASAITYLKAQGYSDSAIMAVSGHASSEVVNAYDKREQKENLTKEIKIVN